MDIKKLLEGLGGTGEATLSLLSGIPASVAGGLAGIGAGGFTPKGAKAVEDVTDFFTYRPRTEAGKLALGETGAAVERLGKGISELPGAKGAMELGYEASAAAPLAAAMAMGAIDVVDPTKLGRAKSAALRAAKAPGAPVVSVSKGPDVEGIVQTVTDAQRIAYPGIYGDPREMVAKVKVAPESPWLKQLFGVTRADLLDISEGGKRKGNIEPDITFGVKKPKGSAAAQKVMVPENAQRLVNILEEAKKRPDLAEGMIPWYVADPVYKRMVELLGPEEAAKEFKRLNEMTSIASAGSPVTWEINRGTAANWLDKQGRMADFLRHGGTAAKSRGADFPADMENVIAHPYHKTAHGKAFERYARGEGFGPDAPKVPLYASASSVPEVGFQTSVPVGDAHFSRIVGLGDTRTNKGFKDSITPEELRTFSPWFGEEVAGKVGLESVPAQALLWGAGSGKTGVKTAIGQPKIEMLAEIIGNAAKKKGIQPERFRDEVLMGKRMAGNIDPELAALLAGLGGATALGAKELYGQDNE